ncbi:MAG: ATP-dependent protease La, partial [Candidatus Hydrothermarchaeota archaeon]
KNIGAELVLVPKGQRIDVEGIKVIEVKDLKEAGEYIFC